MVSAKNNRNSFCLIGAAVFRVYCLWFACGLWVTCVLLVVRGLWSERFKEPQLAMSNRIELTGILRAHQNEDRALNSSGVISRIDSSVIVGLTDLDLYDGYVIAVDEKFRDGDVSRTRVTPEMRTARIPGFYWQHISYVVIWWLMAAVVLYLPIYRRRVVD